MGLNRVSRIVNHPWRAAPALSVVYASLLCAASSDSATVFHGHVVDSTSREPVEGAVVSLVWSVVPADPQPSKASMPTVVTAWQVRTDKNGAFSFASQREQVVLPAGTRPEIASYPSIEVFAFGYKPFWRSNPKDNYALDPTEMKWSTGERQLPLVRESESPENLSKQIREWYIKVDLAVRQEVWPRGKPQAVASYRPFLSLIEDSCYQYRIRFGTSLPACERAKVQFALKDPNLQWQEVAPSDDSTSEGAPAAAASPSDIVLGPPAKPSIELKRQPPPDE